MTICGMHLFSTFKLKKHLSYSNMVKLNLFDSYILPVTKEIFINNLLESFCFHICTLIIDITPLAYSNSDFLTKIFSQSYEKMEYYYIKIKSHIMLLIYAHGNYSIFCCFHICFK